MRKLIFGLFLLFSFVLVSEFANAQAVKIGVVDSEKIVMELPEALEADKLLKDLSKTYQDSLMKLDQNVKVLYQEYQSQSAMMTDQQKQAKEQIIVQLQQEMQAFNQEKFGQQGEIYQKRMELLKPIREKVTKAIEDVAKKEKITIVLEKNTGIVLYSDNKYDITFKVLDLLKRG
jgi:outer membrane protein